MPSRGRGRPVVWLGLVLVIVVLSSRAQRDVAAHREATRLAPASHQGIAQAFDRRVLLPLIVLGLLPSPAPHATPEPTTAASPSPTPEPDATPTAPATSTPIPPDFTPFGLVQLVPQQRLDGSGTVVDSLAFWEAPDPADSLLLVTAKGNGLVEAWRAPFEGPEVAALGHPSFRPGSLVNGIAVDAVLGRALVSVARPASTIAVFALPGLEPDGELVAGAVGLGAEPGLAILAVADGTRRLYATADDRVHVLDVASGERLGGWALSHPAETIVADDFHQVLYVPDETRRGGVYAYHPDGRPFERGGAARFGGGVFEADAEGMAMHACLGQGGRDDGRGLLVVADQRPDATDFEVFDRRSWAHLGTLQLDGVEATDGLASTQQALPGYPEGLLAAVDDDTLVVLIGWDRVAAATALRCASVPQSDP